jgi:hypothetical protein
MRISLGWAGSSCPLPILPLHPAATLHLTAIQAPFVLPLGRALLPTRPSSQAAATTSTAGPTVQFLPYNQTLPRCVEEARADGADFIILLSHIGYTDDLALAADPAAAGVDLIVGK